MIDAEVCSRPVVGVYNVYAADITYCAKSAKRSLRLRKTLSDGRRAVVDADRSSLFAGEGACEEGLRDGAQAPLERLLPPFRLPKLNASPFGSQCVPVWEPLVVRSLVRLGRLGGCRPPLLPAFANQNAGDDAHSPDPS